jgi:hypothetical protein
MVKFVCLVHEFEGRSSVRDDDRLGNPLTSVTSKKIENLRYVIAIDCSFDV